jgi:hypothetical protein
MADSLKADADLKEEKEHLKDARIMEGFGVFYCGGAAPVVLALKRALKGEAPLFLEKFDW